MHMMRSVCALALTLVVVIGVGGRVPVWKYPVPTTLDAPDGAEPVELPAGTP